MAEAMGVTVEYIRQRVDSLCEHNPMLGHRGCRLGNTYPEITEMPDAVWEILIPKSPKCRPKLSWVRLAN